MVTKSTVVILSGDDDAHATSVSERLVQRFDVHAKIWNCSEFPDASTLTFRCDSNGSSTIASSLAGISLDSISSFWWRRPRRPRISDDVTEERVRSYCQEEANRLVRGALLGAGRPIINNPIFQSAANQKTFQLTVAAELGLVVPDTLISNDKNLVRSFLEQHRSAIYKPFHSPNWRIVETREVTPDLIDCLESLRFAPVIFQEHIRLGRDLRVNVFGQDVAAFEAIIDLPGIEYVDWRIHQEHVSWRPFSLPQTIETLLVSMVQRLGLEYGCVDIRESDEGAFVFLEINPEGQFLFLEQSDSFAVIDSFCQLLIRPTE